MTDHAGPPLIPEADVKDWTWVLQTACPECGFDSTKVAGPQVADLVRTTAVRWQLALAGPDVRRRPSPTVWSVLEYGNHCRDVYRVFGERAVLMLEQDDPMFSNWDQDTAALEGRYWAGDPGIVATQLVAAATVAADVFDGVQDDQWGRTGRRSNGSVFNLESLGRYFVHDLVHHLHDVGAAPP